MGVPVLLQCHYAGTREESVQKKVISKHGLISSLMSRIPEIENIPTVFKKQSNLRYRTWRGENLAVVPWQPGFSTQDPVLYPRSTTAPLVRCTPPPFQSGRRQPFSLQI
jgi:hypothetical protein